jgi:hypothetical protein
LNQVFRDVDGRAVTDIESLTNPGEDILPPRAIDSTDDSTDPTENSKVDSNHERLGIVAVETKTTALDDTDKDDGRRKKE